MRRNWPGRRDLRCSNSSMTSTIAVIMKKTPGQKFSTAIDVIALPLALISISLIATGIYRRTRRG